VEDFFLYFSTGWHHIISIDALDHILFVVALASIYLVQNWRQLLVLVTAFTIGHSLTLALSVNDIIRFNQHWVEFLIPCTILLTAVYNFTIAAVDRNKLHWNYLLALFFGLIHGMGFANSIRFMLSKQQGIALPLVSFNLGLEAGQIAVVAFILALSYAVVNKLKCRQQWWTIGLSSIAFVGALQMAAERIGGLL
jgi:hypothetical protein